VRKPLLAFALIGAIALGAQGPVARGTIGCTTTTTLDPTACRSCHTAIAERHASSAHARADDSVVFRALRERAPATTRAFCDRCHSPRHERGERGVGCLACHGVVGNQGTANARFIQGDDDTVQGPTGATGHAAPHATRREPFTTSAELCGTCHEVAGGGAFVETPYTEWAQSPAHAQGTPCAQCHMAKTPGDPTSGFARGAIASGVEDRPLGDHAFPALEGGLFDRAASIAIARQGSKVALTLKNENPGHALPAGARFLRRLTLEVTASDGASASWELGERMLLDGVETFDALAADGHEVRALDASATRTFTFEAGGAVQARLVYRVYDERVLATLGLDPALAEPHVIASSAILE
jgi:hypothetical protein